MIHLLDPRVKLLGFGLVLTLVFLLKHWYDLTALLFLLLAVAWLARLPLVFVLKNLNSLALVIVLAFLFNMFLTPGETLLQWHFLKISKEGVIFGGLMALRLAIIIIATAMLTLTVSYLQLTDALESLMQPVLKSQAHEVALMMGIALRFLPLLLLEAEKIFKAQLARGADFEQGNVFRRAYLLFPILLPLFIQAFRTAEELAVAMEARCYTGGQGRTRLRELKIMPGDYWVMVIMGITAIIFWGVEWLSGTLK